MVFRSYNENITAQKFKDDRIRLLSQFSNRLAFQVDGASPSSCKILNLQFLHIS